MKQIHTREQLIFELVGIFNRHYDPDWEEFNIDACAIEIVDLIANLPNTCYHHEGYHSNVSD